MPVPDASNPIVFFKAMCHAFGLSLAAGRKHKDPIADLSRQAYESFARGVACEARQDTPVACHGGCSSCCTIRVAATAPEISERRTSNPRFSTQAILGPDTKNRSCRSHDQTSRSTATHGVESGVSPD